MGNHKDDHKMAATPATPVPAKITDVPAAPAVKVEDEAKHVEGKHDAASTDSKTAEKGKDASHATGGSK